MFRSQVIKCYELPYCTLDILTQNRFRLIIESLDQALEPTFELSSDRAQLLPLANTLQQYWQSVTPPATYQQEREPLYPIHFMIHEQSFRPKLSWEQLSDLVKILELYQTDLKKNPTLNRNHQAYRVSFIGLVLLAIIGSLLTRVKMDSQSLSTEIQPSPSSPEQTTPSSTTPSETTPPFSPLKHVSKKQLKLSESLEQLEQLSPPPSVITPSTTISRDFPNLQPPTPIPESPVTPPNQQLPITTFPEASHSRKPVNFTPTPQPETLFDQPHNW